MKSVTTIMVVCILFVVGGIFFISTFNQKTVHSRFKGTIVTSMWNPASINTTSTPTHSPTSPNAQNIPPNPKLSSQESEILSDPHPGEPKVILFWTTYYGNGRWKINSGKEVCGQYTCILTYDKKQYDTANALMFHHRTDWLLRLPTDRPRVPWQRWVLYNRESSWWGPKGDLLNKANNLLNWTMGFRHDDDMTIPTAVITKRQFKGGFDPNKNYMEGKTGDITALMSACIYYPHAGYEGRRKYIEFLTSHGLKVDMYGKCGKDCGGRFSACSKVLQKYKFVLAFENSLCDEYISEKPYRNGLMLGVVPVVMSGANLSNPYVIPPGSYIDAGQFTSVSALVAFLKKVGSDPKLYNKYFEWRKDWDLQILSEGEGQEEFRMDYFCPLCTKLHEDFAPKFIRNVREWHEQEKCKEYPAMNP